LFSFINKIMFLCTLQELEGHYCRTSSFELSFSLPSWVCLRTRQVSSCTSCVRSASKAFSLTWLWSAHISESLVICSWRKLYTDKPVRYMWARSAQTVGLQHQTFLHRLHSAISRSMFRVPVVTLSTSMWSSIISHTVKWSFMYNINVKKQCVRTTCFGHKTKTANIKKVVSPSITSPKCQRDVKQYNLFDICCFSFVTKTSRPYTLF